MFNLLIKDWQPIKITYHRSVLAHVTPIPLWMGLLHLGLISWISGALKPIWGDTLSP